MNKVVRHRMFDRAGFSLIEVNLAIMLIAVGMMTLFALFPYGLRESELGIDDTQEAMFADSVLAGIAGNAMMTTNWNDWADPAGFAYLVVAGVLFDTPNPGGARTMETLVPDDEVHKVYFCSRSMRYKLDIEGDGVLRSVTLKAKSGRYGAFENTAKTYYSAVIYSGM